MSQLQKASLVSNATRTYSVAVQDVLTLQKQPANETSLQAIRGRLPFLRRLITCCACGGLLDDAMVSTCDHHYCFKCQFREPVLPIHCRQCRDRNNLVPALQLRTLVLCYHNLCHLLATFYSPGMATGTSVVAMGDVSPRPSNEFDPITELLKEASSVDYKCPPSVFRLKSSKASHRRPTCSSHSSPASIPSSPDQPSRESRQQLVGTAQTDTQCTPSDSPLTGMEVKHALNTPSPPSVVSKPSNPECLRVESEARTKQGKDQHVVMSSECRIHSPAATSFTTGLNNTREPSAKQPIANTAKRRKVNRNWK